MTTKRDANIIEPEEVRILSPHNRALYEAGKKMLIDSVDAGKEFCRFMITTTLSAIPIYVSIVGLSLSNMPENKRNVFLSILGVLPIFLFLVATTMFVFGYFPRVTRISLDLPEEIDEAREAIIRSRYNFIIAGMLSFVLGIVLSVKAVVGIFLAK